MAFYESKHRILKTLSQLPPDRSIVVGRELTKLYETIYRGLPPEVMEKLESTSTKGEFTIVVGPI